MMRGRFALRCAGDDPKKFELAGSEWWLFGAFERIARTGQELVWLESAGCPLVPRSLDALNVYLRSGALRRFPTRVDRTDGRKLIGLPEWTRFCRMLNLKFDGRGTGVLGVGVVTEDRATQGCAPSAVTINQGKSLLKPHSSTGEVFVFTQSTK